MKLSLRDPSSIPGRQWEALVPETGARLVAASRASLIPLVRKHREANDLSSLGEADNIDQYICAALTPTQRARRCAIVPEPGEVVKATPTSLETIARFVRQVLKNGWSYVPQEQADSRAEICSMCPSNVPSFGCGACEAATVAIQGVTDMVAQKSTPFDPMLKSCAVCGCALRLKVWLETEQDNSFPAHCWVRKGM